MVNMPALINIDKKDLELYKSLGKEVLNFGEREEKEQFLFALATGFKYHDKSELSRKHPYFRSSYLLPKDISLLRAVALFETKDVEILNNWAKIFDIAEMYAHSGIRLLFENVKNTPLGKFEKKLEEELIEKIQLMNKVRDDEAKTGNK